MRGGGAERQVSYILKKFPSAIILCLEDGNDYNIDPEKMVILNKKPFNLLNKYLNIFYFIITIPRKVTLNKNTTILSLMDLPNMINLSLSFFFPIRSILSIRTNLIAHSQSFSLAKPIFSTLYKVYGLSNNLTTNSYGTKIDLVKVGLNKKKITVIPNMFDIESVRNLGLICPDLKWNSVFEYQTIVCVGSLKESKGFENIINVFSRLKSENKNLKLVIVGEGDLLSVLKHQISNLNLICFDSEINELNNNYDVFFTGFQKNPYWFVKNSTIFALPSLYEGLPNVLIEALILSSVVVSADCPSGPREILAPNSTLDFVTDKVEFAEFGILLPKFQNKSYNDEIEKKWHDLLKKILTSPKIRQEYKTKALIRAESYSVNKIYHKWENLFNLK
jgi:glycosyltransferase involved in cell wall biosynthesis